MGYEYDYVFDWMVKKPNAPNNALGVGKAEEDKQNEGEGTGTGQNGAGSTGKNQTTQ